MTNAETPLADSSIAPTKQLYSVGFVAGMVQAPPDAILQTMQLLNIAPTIVLNAVPYITGEDVQRLAGFFKEVSASYRAQQEKAEAN